MRWRPLTDLHMRLIYDLELDELSALLRGWDQPAYRAVQVWHWLYARKATAYRQMTDLPQALRTRLADETRLDGLEVIHESHSSDGETLKWLLRLADGQLIETVLMRYETRRTACLSTQAGCAMGCAFCATGQMGFARNLTVGEIVGQALLVARRLEDGGERLSNVVLMGMGEPFHNYEATLAALRRLNDPDGLNIGQRHITVSTVGVVPGIRRFADEGTQFRLAVSLHAATDQERGRLLPVNQKWPLDELLDAVRYYVKRTARRVTFEWALISGENDTPSQAHALGRLLEGLTCHVNLIPLNPTDGYRGEPSDPQRVARFAEIVAGCSIPVTVRTRRGIDVNAGCGQLKAEISGRRQAAGGK
jgi:23S rRNA (adenine2503-C2)-methyltransferase